MSVVFQHTTFGIYGVIMGSLRDEAYEKLDYLSQLTEVVIGPQNEVLGRAPDTVNLSFDDVMRFKSVTWGGPGFNLDVHQILIANLPTEDWSYIPDIKQHFQLEVSPDFELDVANQKMTGSIRMVKTVQQVDEKQLLQIALTSAKRHLQHYDWPSRNLRNKIVTVLNTFEAGKGTEWAQQLDGNAKWSGVNAVSDALDDAIMNNKWRIRDTKVILKIGQWINSYLQDETDKDLGLVNLMKLKIMLDKDLPIYSVDEVKNVDGK